jgi:hypothetical protein
MGIKIAISTNRIFFENFKNPCGEPELTEIRREWESVIYRVLENNGFEAEVEIGVGHDPAVSYAIQIEGVCCGWSNAGLRDVSIAREIREIADELTAACEVDCDSTYRVCSALESLIPAALRDARRVADLAIDKAREAANELSGQFVAESENNN